MKRRYSLKMKFGLLMGGFALSLTSIIGLHLFTSKKIIRNLNYVEEIDFPKYSFTSNLVQQFEEISGLYEDAVLTGEPILLDKAEEEQKLFEENLKELKKKYLAGRQAEFQDTEILFQKYFSNAGDLARLLLKNNPTELSELGNESIGQKSQIVSSLKKQLEGELNEQFLASRARVHQSFETFRYNVKTQFLRFLIIGTASFLILFIFLVWLTRRITNPILILSRITADVAKGNFDSPVDIPTLSNDEVGVLARSFNAMKKGLKETTVSKAYVDNIIKSMADFLMVLDNSGNMITLNAATLRRLAFDKSELLGRPIEKILKDSSFIEWCIKENLSQEGFFSEKEKFLMTKDNYEIPVLFSVSLLKSNDGKPEGYVCVAQDITALKNAEKELEKRAIELTRSNEDLEQFAYVASHDLQEPLRMVTSYLQLLQKRYQGKLDKSADEFIYYATDGAARMKELINDLLAFSRLGRGQANREPVDIKKLLNRLEAVLVTTLKESNAEIEIGPMPEVMGDAKQLYQLFQNLVTNGIKYSDKKSPRVKISAHEEPEKWIFKVEDNGIGMEKKYLSKIFVIFQRLHTKQEYPGSGIGLAICKKIVERHEGNIWVESEWGKGSCFYFSLPKASPNKSLQNQALENLGVV